jgi:6,7-dimethyl-8-ribityllumazine synthase
MRYDRGGFSQLSHDTVPTMQGIFLMTLDQEPMKWSADAKGLRFAIVVARFNPAITDKLLQGAQEALKAAGAAEVNVAYVPGAFELALAALHFAKSYDAVIALGAVIRGETPHFDFVAGAAAQGLQHVSIQTGKPVSFGVLTTDTFQQAVDRAGGAHGNKGFDAAMTAIEMARLVAS